MKFINWLLRFFKKKVMGAAFPIIDSEDNLAKGEIVEFNFIESCKGHDLGKRITEDSYGAYEGENPKIWYERIWVNVGGETFKCIGKWEYHGIL